MGGLTDQAAGPEGGKEEAAARAHAAWQASMERQFERLRTELQAREPEEVARRSGCLWAEPELRLEYWKQPVRISWPGLQATFSSSRPLSTFDTAMLLYYLHAADGAPLTGRWISFRELPGGAFYHQAFQGYSGNRLAQVFGENPQSFARAAAALGGWPLPELNEWAFGFLPLPRLPIAAILWPGDEDFPSRASILFEACASHYMITDGLALLGSGLAGRLAKVSSQG